MEQASFGFAEEVVEETTYSVVQLNSHGRRGGAAGPARRGLGEGRGPEPPHAQRPHLLQAGREGRAGRPDPGPARRRALPATTRRRSRRALKEVPGAELGDDVEVRIRGRVADLPAHRPVPAGDDRHRPGVHRRRLAANRERVLRALAAEGLLGANAALELRAGAAAGRPDHQRRQRRLPRLRRRAAALAVRVAGRRGRRRGAERGARPSASSGRSVSSRSSTSTSWCSRAAAARVPTSRRSTPSSWRGRSRR